VAIHRRPLVVDRDGVRGWLRRLDVTDPHTPLAIIQLDNSERVTVPFELLAHDDSGDGYTIPARWSDFPRVGDETLSIPVLAEQVTVDVRPGRMKRARVRRRVVSEARVVETPIRHERLEVTRVPVDLLVDQAPEPRRDGDTLIVPCIEEVAVVVKRLRVREELRIRVVKEQTLHRETVTLRRHEIEVESTEDARSTTSNNPTEGDEP
jgi:stress response protein YsnF